MQRPRALQALTDSDRDRLRSKIEVGRILNRLGDVALGLESMKSYELNAARILLDKALPDLKSIASVEPDLSVNSLHSLDTQSLVSLIHALELTSRGQSANQSGRLISEPIDGGSSNGGTPASTESNSTTLDHIPSSQRTLTSGAGKSDDVVDKSMTEKPVEQPTARRTTSMPSAAQVPEVMNETKRVGKCDETSDTHDRTKLNGEHTTDTGTGSADGGEHETTGKGRYTPVVKGSIVEGGGRLRSPKIR